MIDAMHKQKRMMNARMAKIISFLGLDDDVFKVYLPNTIACYNLCMPTFIFRLDEILKERKINPHQFSEQAGVAYITILRICHNQNKGITLDVTWRICNALQIRADELFREEK
jgi:DNA-binding Xre family transcriptional regulator